jgi:hypothetical protein
MVNVSYCAQGLRLTAGANVARHSENPLARTDLTARASKCQQYVSGESNLPGKAVCPEFIITRFNEQDVLGSTCGCE